jgi:RNA polymerase sigma-70 factor (ECF subfamily)
MFYKTGHGAHVGDVIYEPDPITRPGVLLGPPSAAANRRKPKTPSPEIGASNTNQLGADRIVGAQVHLILADENPIFLRRMFQILRAHAIILIDRAPIGQFTPPAIDAGSVSAFYVPALRIIVDVPSHRREIDLTKEERFQTLFLRSERRIYAYVLALIARREDVDDLMQDIFRVMWEKFDAFTVGTDFTAWGISIARYRALDYHRKQRLHRAVFHEHTLEAIAEKIIRISSHEDHRIEAMLSCATKLRAPDRELLHLRYHCDQTVRDVAAQVGRSPDSVYKSLNRIHSQLLLCIQDRLSEEDRK